MRSTSLALVIAAALSLAGCGEEAAEAPAALGALRILCLGDSLTQGHGLRRDQAFPARLEARLRARGLEVAVENGGVSGHTAAQGLARLPALLTPRPDWVFVCLGANDGLRHLPVEGMRSALKEIVGTARVAGCKVALAGVRLPPSPDFAYSAAFAAAFPALAAELNLPLLPDLLEGVGGKPELNLPDRLHPNARGQELIAARVGEFLEPWLRAP